MAYGILNDEHLIAIGSAIRAKNNTRETYKASEMAAAINALPSGDIEDELVARTITNYSNDRVEDVGAYAFYECNSLVTAKFANATLIWNNAFENCNYLTTVDLGSATVIAFRAFRWCSKLTTLILRRTDMMCVLNDTNALSYTEIEDGTGYIYVPRALLSEYKADDDWKTYANQFRAIEDYPSICG